ncbi:hypothetical protein KMZ68_13815 [Bradyrhizobium sediminis]|uniref:Uncharacterized protein n=1 Tax=Bradyrhizobium sediminis TaxID=2840469 RepID=A0A975NKB5_9BRAD|nr:hypothetical protein [Bradyrhizobium sediminis]QWG16121.1 hypothetical protein KMZ68_13815 [Bradyrhizobium sediminis]
MAKSDLEQRLVELPEDQFAQAAQAFEAAKSARRTGGNDPEQSKKIAILTAGQFQALKDKLMG